MSETPVSPAPPAAGGDVVREQDKIQLVLAYLGLLSLIPLLTVKDSDYVKFHAKQGLALFIVSIGWYVVTGILSSIALPFVFGLLNCFASLGILTLMVLGIVKAFKPERWKIPYVCLLAEKLNF